MASSSSTTLDILQATITGVAEYLANAAIYLIVFAFLFGMFTSIIIILASWKTR